MSKLTEYIFVQYKTVDVIHPIHGKISETRNYELSNELFICIAKTKTHVLIKNANPFRQVYVAPELLPLEIIDITWTVPGNFVKAYLREVDKMRRKVAAHRKKGGRPPAPIEDAAPESMIESLLGGKTRIIRIDRNPDEPPTEEPGSTADIPPVVPTAPGNPSKS